MLPALRPRGDGSGNWDEYLQDLNLPRRHQRPQDVLQGFEGKWKEPPQAVDRNASRPGLGDSEGKVSSGRGFMGRRSSQSRKGCMSYPRLPAAEPMGVSQGTRGSLQMSSKVQSLAAPAWAMRARRWLGGSALRSQSGKECMKYVVAMAVPSGGRRCVTNRSSRQDTSCCPSPVASPRRVSAASPWPSPSPDAVLATIYAAVKPGEGSVRSSASCLPNMLHRVLDPGPAGLPPW